MYYMIYDYMLFMLLDNIHIYICVIYVYIFTFFISILFYYFKIFIAFKFNRFYMQFYTYNC